MNETHLILLMLSVLVIVRLLGLLRTLGLISVVRLVHRVRFRCDLVGNKTQVTIFDISHRSPEFATFLKQTLAAPFALLVVSSSHIFTRIAQKLGIFALSWIRFHNGFLSVHQHPQRTSSDYIFAVTIPFGFHLPASTFSIQSPSIVVTFPRICSSCKHQ